MRRFLLVDDDSIFNFLHTEVIKAVDELAQINLFNSSTEGLEFLQDALEGKREMPHFLFLDIRMPEMDGFEYLDELMKYPVEKFKELRIYVLSSSLAERDKEKSLSSPIVTGFIEKTLTIEKLKGIIETYPV
jgi:CheY-like chemotaxis protein